MNYTYTKYCQLNNQLSPNYLRENDALQALVDEKTPLSDVDIQHLIEFLNSDESPNQQYFVTDFLTLYREKIPKALYKAVFYAGIRHRDPSYNKSFFRIAEEIKGERAFFKDLVGIIRTGNDFEKVKAVDSLYWNFSLYWCFVGESEYAFNKDTKLHIETYRPRIDAVMETLVNEFLENDNLIVRYAISKFLPREMTRYPKSLKSKGKKVLGLIDTLGLPKGVSANTLEFVHIWKAAIQDDELGKLFFDELKWRSRSHDPETEIASYTKHIAEIRRRAKEMSPSLFERMTSFFRQLFQKG